MKGTYQGDLYTTCMQYLCKAYQGDPYTICIKEISKSYLSKRPISLCWVVVGYHLMSRFCAKRSWQSPLYYMYKRDIKRVPIKEAYMYKMRLVKVTCEARESDLYTWKECVQAGRLSAWYMQCGIWKRRIYMQRDLYIWNETYVCEKSSWKAGRLSAWYMKGDIWKKTMCMKRDQYVWKETCEKDYTYQKGP